MRLQAVAATGKPLNPPSHSGTERNQHHHIHRRGCRMTIETILFCIGACVVWGVGLWLASWLERGHDEVDGDVLRQIEQRNQVQERRNNG